MPIATDYVSEPDAASREYYQEVVGTHQKQLPPPPTTITNIIFFDWDDTLLCSSILSGQGIKLNSEIGHQTEILQQLDELSDNIISVLNAAMTYGEVHIVTNGETGWVELSAQKFLPRVVPLLEKIQVLSARSTFEKMYPDSPMEWKFHAFEQRLANLYAGPPCFKNVISFGDSHAEREAIRAVTKGLPYTKTKSIKFAERPTVEQLQRQLELAVSSLQYIINHGEDLDLCMSLSVTADAAAAAAQPGPV